MQLVQSTMWQAIEKRLAITTNPRHRAMLEVVIEHAQAEAAAMIEEARRYRAKVRAQIRATREQLHAVMSSAGLPVPLVREDADVHGTDDGDETEASTPDPTRQREPLGPSNNVPWARPAPPETVAWSPEPTTADPWESGVRR